MLRKDQDALALQLHRYLTKQNSMVDFLQLLFNQGYCYSISLCRAAMRITGKLNWWDAALDEIFNWDGMDSSLQKKVILPDSTNGESVTLQLLFEQFIHYLVFNQGSSITYPYIESNQFTFLLPGGQFELLHGSEILRIKSNYRIAGHFSLDDLAQCLKDKTTIEAIKNNICLVYNDGHACELSYLEEKWHFYDPNYLNGKAKSYANIQHLVEEIMRVMGKDISVELACFNPLINKPFAYYDELLNKQAERLIEDKGLLIIARKYPSIIPNLFENLKKEKVKIDVKIFAHVNSNDWNALMSAAQNCDIEVIKTLCDAGANPNLAKSDGWTAMMLAAQVGRVEVVKALCNVGANPNLTQSEGWTALMIAVQHGHIDVIKVLLGDAKANPDLTQPNGWTALMLAVYQGNIEAIKLLCHAGANPHTPLPNQALHFAIKQILPDSISAEEYTVLHLAAYLGHKESVSILLEKMSKLKIETLDMLSKLSKALNHIDIQGLFDTRIAEINENTKSVTGKRKRSDTDVVPDYAQEQPNKRLKVTTLFTMPTNLSESLESITKPEV